MNIEQEYESLKNDLAMDSYGYSISLNAEESHLEEIFDTNRYQNSELINTQQEIEALGKDLATKDSSKLFACRTKGQSTRNRK